MVARGVGDPRSSVSLMRQGQVVVAFFAKRVYPPCLAFPYPVLYSRYGYVDTAGQTISCRRQRHFWAHGDSQAEVPHLVVRICMNQNEKTKEAVLTPRSHLGWKLLPSDLRLMISFAHHETHVRGSAAAVGIPINARKLSRQTARATTPTSTCIPGMSLRNGATFGTFDLSLPNNFFIVDNPTD